MDNAATINPALIKVVFLNPFFDNFIVAIRIMPMTAGLIPKNIGSILGKLPYSTKTIANNNVIKIRFNTFFLNLHSIAPTFSGFFVQTKIIRTFGI